LDGSDLTKSVLALADADPTLSEQAKFLILAALDSDAMLAETLSGDATPAVDSDQSAEPEAEPVGAFLRSIEVTSFRGIGQKVRLPLQPGPGLVVIAGRNGSGKSSIAEALEMALTGNSYRWANKSSVWSDNWRNLHSEATPEIRVELTEEGVGVTTIGVDWKPLAEHDQATFWIQRPGKKKESGLGNLGWARAQELYRPFLSYEELGGVIDRKRPSELHDKLFALLGLERVVEARKRLDAVSKQLQASDATARSLAQELKRTLPGSTNARAKAALTLISKRPPAVDAIEGLAVGAGESSADPTADLRRLAQLPVPDVERLMTSAADVKSAAATVEGLAATIVNASEQRADLLEKALRLHAAHGDGACPVCGVGTLNEDWALAARQAVDSERAELSELRAARHALDAAQRSARALVAEIAGPPLPAVDDLATLPAARVARGGWLAVPTDDAQLADHLLNFGPFVTAIEALRIEAAQEFAETEANWTPYAVRLAEWVRHAREAQTKASAVADVTKAVDWFKANAADLRNQRLAPLAERAKHIWAALGQESNVGLGAIRLEGEATKRRVELTAEVDGATAGAFGVMSQGELHALALALFLPRATAAESPFRFIVLDDPVQAMDPSKVEGLVTVLQELAVDRQVIVFSHDDRLPAAVRRAKGKATILEVTRGTKSVVVVGDALSPATRYLDDAYALALDDDVPDSAKNKVIPSLCRMAFETTAYDVFVARALAAGETREFIETTWDKAKKLGPRLALALDRDPDANYKPWLKQKPHRELAFRECNSGVHVGSGKDHLELQKAVRATVKDLRATFI
jgi:predicted ATPase